MDLATNWIEATEAQLNRKVLGDEQEAALIELFELSSDQPGQAIKIFQKIAERAPSSSIMNCLGAGPIEELLVKHPGFLEQLITLALNSHPLQHSLMQVTLPEDDPKSVDRLREFVESITPQ
ncbi:MAG TPA: hypothetical protein VF816_09695 [Rhodocyclaceae bacterium]